MKATDLLARLAEADERPGPEPTTAPTCTVCGAPVADGLLYHCAECADALHRADPGRLRRVAAELLTAGDHLGWPELVVETFPGRPDRPFMTILPGEANWIKAAQFPPPGFLEAALAAAKVLLEKELPL